MNEKPWPTEADHERRQRADHRAAKLDRRIIAADRQAES